MIIIKSQRQENQDGAGGKGFMSDNNFGQSQDSHRNQMQNPSMHNNENVSRSMYEDEQMMNMMDRNNAAPAKQTDSEPKLNPNSMNQANNNIVKQQQAMLGPNMFAYSNEQAGQISNNNMRIVSFPDSMMMQTNKTNVTESEPRIINEFKNRSELQESDSLAEVQSSMIQENKPTNSHFTIVNTNINVSKEDVESDNVGTEIFRQMLEKNDVDSRMGMDAELDLRGNETKDAIKDYNVITNSVINPNKEGTNL